MWLLQLPPKLSTPFLSNGLGFTTRLSKPASSSSVSLSPSPSFMPAIRAMKSMEGRVVCDTNDKTVAVEVVRLAPHHKYKRRVRKKKKYRAHDPDNMFKVGDIVQLRKTRPISKNKTFLAVPVPARNRKSTDDESSSGGDLPLPLQSQQEEQPQP